MLANPSGAPNEPSGDRLSFAAHGRLGEDVGALDRLGPSNKPLARVGQFLTAVALVEERAVQLVLSA